MHRTGPLGPPFLRRPVASPHVPSTAARNNRACWRIGSTCRRTPPRNRCRCRSPRDRRRTQSGPGPRSDMTARPTAAPRCGCS
ncbi:hypothetical protein AKJ08_0814 [Vulgatibacter incomptus]|uniref:Uncharacterized protein n=1 Tax=Vulgatibacter incomptus TaxID=1391653 RepID=A0A0K1PA99_9BACT|nr:hypothetical protein AKJ08_0814 [Vulgatibacter incomptus]